MASLQGFCSGAVEVSVLLGYGAASVDDWYPTFRDSVFSSSSVECPVSRNARHQSSSARHLILEEKRHKTNKSQVHSMLYDWLRNLCTRTSITGVPWHTNQSQNAYHSTTCSTIRTVKLHELSYLNFQFVAVQPTEIPRASVENYTTV